MKQLLSIIFLTSLLSLNAQELYYLDEDFEDISSRSKWSQDPTGKPYQWEFTDKGQDLDNEGNGRYPYTNYQGNQIAGLWRPDVVLVTMKLISPAVELDGAKKPTLRFAHTQWSDDGPDFLSLYFRSGPNSPWDLIEQWTSQIAYWKDDEIYDIGDIDEKYLTDTFQLAFEGLVGNGRGVYIDSVTIREEEIVERFVKKTTYKSVEHTLIPGGATDIPLENITIRVLGNTGVAILDSIVVEPEGAGKDYLVPSSYKLWMTNGETFATEQADTSTFIANGTLSGGKVYFPDLSIDLDLGNNYFWVSASFADTLKGSTSLKFKVPANGINVSDTIFPATETYFTENHYILESIYYDNFESGGGDWSFSGGGSFEVGVPVKVAVDIMNNPSMAYNGNNILATNLNGGYPPNITSGTEIYAYSPVLDLTYHISPKLYFQSWILINNADVGVIEYSLDGGSSWENIWTSDLSLNNSAWTEFIDETISEVASRQPQFQIRFGITKSYSTPWPGFSIDNFAIVAEKLYKDIGVTEIVSPINECMEGGNNQVQAWFKNYAEADAPSIIPVYYGLWGRDSILVRDTIVGGIPKDDSVLFTFDLPADYPKADFYNKFIVGVDLYGDQDPINDTLKKNLIIQKSITPAHLEDFEYKGGIWVTQDTASWTYADMTGTVDPIDPATPMVWVLSEDGDYWNNDKSWVTSGCYDLSGESRNIVQFDYWSDLEFEKDGIRIEYSRDAGASWEVVNDPEYDQFWNWMPDTVGTLQSKGWTGSSLGWLTSKAVLPVDVDTAVEAKFRVLFKSDASNTAAQGFAFDNFAVFPAPLDIGVSKVLSPIDACQGINSATEVGLRIKNYGLNPLYASDSIIVGVDFESEAPVIDTVILPSDLLPGDSIDISVNVPIDITDDGVYSMDAYTLIEDDPWYYNGNNDSTSHTFTIWANPDVTLADTIGTRQPDTLDIVPQYNDWVAGYTYYWTPGDITDSIYNVSANGFGDTIYHLTVTEPVNLCETHDSVNVLLLFYDAGADSIISPYSNCEWTNSEIVQFAFKNTGTDSIFTEPGDTARIVLGFQVNGGTVFSESVKIIETLHAGDVLTHSFTDYPYDFSAENAYTLKVWAYYDGGDKSSANDTVTRIVNTYGYTPLDIGPPSLVVEGLTHTLIASPNFVTYDWRETEETTQVIVVDNSVEDKSGQYTIWATDINNCMSKDSILLTFVLRDVKPQFVIDLADSCDNTINDYIRLSLINNGTDTIRVTDTIYYSYQVDGGDFESEWAYPRKQILPAAEYSHTFGDVLDFTEAKSYSLRVTASAKGDLRPANDTILHTFFVRESPVVDFGEIQEPIPGFEYELDAEPESGTGPFTYLWQDNATTTQTYLATESETNEFSVIVTDANGCKGYDTAMLVFDILDYSVTSLDGFGLAVCQFEKKELSAYVTNMGNKPRHDVALILGYTIDGGTAVEQEFTVDGAWNSGPANAQKLTFPNLVSMDENGTSELEVYVKIDGDMKPENDNFIQTVPVNEAPFVDFGGDTINLAIPGTLDAGEHDSYIWQDSYDGRYYNVTSTNPALYTVTVTDIDNSSCITTRSVFVEPMLGINDYNNENLELSLYPNPANEFININAADLSGKELYVEIYSINNQLIWSDYHDGFGTYSKKLDIGSFNAGVYLLRIKNSDINFIQRFIIK